jgi:hypothetical protein
MVVIRSWDGSVGFGTVRLDFDFFVLKNEGLCCDGANPMARVVFEAGITYLACSGSAASFDFEDIRELSIIAAGAHLILMKQREVIVSSCVIV